MKTIDKTIKALCAATESHPRDWEEIDGPPSRHGIDRWFRHKQTGDEANTNNDQGHITVSHWPAEQPVC
jgi:hypothetical protein